MIRVGALALVIALASSQLAEACNCRGIFKRRCSSTCTYYKAPQQLVKKYYYPQKAQQIVVPQQVVNISNVYPQGQTTYASASVSQVSALYATNPEQMALLAAKRGDNADQNFRAALSLATATNSSVAEVARIQALTEHLRAGLTASLESNAPKNLTLQITQSGSGVTVKKLESPPVNPNGNGNGNGSNPPQPQPMPPAEALPDENDSLPPPPVGDIPASSLLHAKCAECHGFDKPKPAAKLYVDFGAKIGCEDGIRGIEILKGVNIPEKMKPVIAALTKDEQDQLIDELLAITVRKEGE